MPLAVKDTVKRMTAHQLHLNGSFMDEKDWDSGVTSAGVRVFYEMLVWRLTQSVSARIQLKEQPFHGQGYTT